MKHLKSLTASTLTAALLLVGPLSATAVALANSSASGDPTLRQQASELKQQAAADKEDQAQHKACQVRQPRVAQRMTDLVNASQRVDSRIDSIFSEALAYQQKQKLNPSGFDGLVTTAQNAKSAAATSVAALKTAVPTIDCTSSDKLVDQAAGFRSQLKQTHDALKAYRNAVKPVLQALISAKTGQGGSQ